MLRKSCGCIGCQAPLRMAQEAEGTCDFAIFGEIILKPRIYKVGHHVEVFKDKFVSSCILQLAAS